MGPTGSGKTETAVKLAKEFDGEIISVDSALVYRGMDIGTAKPTMAERQGIVHHLIDICDPADAYSAAAFRNDAIRIIGKIIDRGKLPILAGGTMLYFWALQQGLSPLPSANSVVRESLEAAKKREGVEAMHHRLEAIDPVSASRIKPNDWQRIQRALEVFEITGSTLTAIIEKAPAEESPYEYINIALWPEDRLALHMRLAKRFHKMLELGFLDEVQDLFDREDLNHDLPSIRSVGYRQAWDFLAGDLEFDEMIDKAIVATRQLAKRQYTWLRKWKDIHNFDPLDEKYYQEISKTIKNLLA